MSFGIFSEILYINMKVATKNSEALKTWDIVKPNILAGLSPRKNSKKNLFEEYKTQ